MNTIALEKDLSYFHSMYPPMGARILNLVILEVDRLSYPQSFLFDEYPDSFALNRMAERILTAFRSELSAEAEANENILPGEETSDTAIYSNPDGIPWLILLINALLYDEIIQLRRRQYNP